MLFINRQKWSDCYRIDWDDARDSNGSELMQFYRDKEVLSGTDYLKVFGENFDLKNGNVFLDVLSVNDNKINRFDIDPENSYHDFIFRWDDNITPPEVNLSSNKKYIRISHEFSNEIILFNNQGEFVQVVQYEPQKTPKRAKIPSGPQIKQRDQAGKDYQRILEQVRFEFPVWDSVKKLYLLLSSKKIFTETYIDNNFVPEIKKTLVFLPIFDAEFNLIFEMEIGELNNERVKYFAKEGKLWICQNFSDELGFIVIDIQALTIALIYKKMVLEVLIKQIKQNFELNYFLADSENGIKIQIWVVLILNLLFTVLHRRIKEAEDFPQMVMAAAKNLCSYISLEKFLVFSEAYFNKIFQKSSILSKLI